jgi:hypothetical protein
MKKTSPKENDLITFLVPFGTKSGDSIIIQSNVNGKDCELTISDKEQLKTILEMILQDASLLDAKVRVKNNGFEIVEHSPQKTFFNLTDEFVELDEGD